LADPTTTNVLLAVPTRGSDPGTWDVPVNNNTTAADGYFGGVVTINLTGTPITLTAPAGTPTPGAGPFQSQNRTLVFTGTLTANVAVTLPLPGQYTVFNNTSGAFIVTFNAVSTGNIVSTPQGSFMEIFCDGTNVFLIKNQIPGALTFLGGISAVPAWITACTLPPFLLCAGGVFNFSQFPALGNLYLGNFGGNGITTFGVQDLQGRVPLAFDGTGTRITTAGSGINGQTMGAAGGLQTETLTAAQIPGITSAGALILATGNVLSTQNTTAFSATPGVQTFNAFPSTSSQSLATQTGTANVVSNNTGGAPHPNVQPSQVAGIWLVAT
jgi:microcystin-dependent protein